jgi:signal peptidase I
MPNIETHRRTDHILIKIVGASMLPLLRHGSSATVEFCSFEEMRPGDLAVFKKEGGEFVCHRVLGKHRQGEQSFLKTKGDALFYFDPLLKKESFVGRVAIVHIGSFRVNVNHFLCRFLGLGLGCTAPFIVRSFSKLKYALRSIWTTV